MHWLFFFGFSLNFKRHTNMHFDNFDSAFLLFFSLWTTFVKSMTIILVSKWIKTLQSTQYSKLDGKWIVFFYFLIFRLNETTIFLSGHFKWFLNDLISLRIHSPMATAMKWWISFEWWIIFEKSLCAKSFRLAVDLYFYFFKYD